MTFVVEDRRRWTLPLLVRERAQQLGDSRLISCAADDRSLSYGEADLLSDRLAAGLTDLGLRPGNRALIMMGNRTEFVLTWFALAKLGACHAPVNVEYRGGFLEHVARIAEAKVIVLERRFVPTVLASAAGMPHLEHVVVVDPAPDDDPGPLRMSSFASCLHDTAPPVVDINPSDPYAVMFTSGSTGRSKAALIPQAHAHLLTERNAELLALEAGSVYLSELPLFHINAHLTVHGALLTRGEARLETRFSASRWLARLRAANATHTSMLGVMVDFVTRRPETLEDRAHHLHSVWMVPCVPGLAERFRRRFGVPRIVTSYGTTECGMLARRVVQDGAPSSAGTVPRDLYDVRLADASGASVPTGEPGEILVRNQVPYTMVQSYLGDPELTMEAFRDLWFHTGDIGRFDADDQLVFVDRLQDRLRRRGENIASADLEHALGAHPDLAEVAVVAVAASEQGGEDEIKACLVPRDGVTFDAGAFWAWCDEHLPAFAVPRYLEVLAALPRTETAKVIKPQLRATGTGPGVLDRAGPASVADLVARFGEPIVSAAMTPLCAVLRCSPDDVAARPGARRVLAVAARELEQRAADAGAATPASDMLAAVARSITAPAAR